MQKLKSFTSWFLIVAGCLMFATFGIVRWTEQQVLNTDNWVATVSKLPQDKAVAEAISSQIVDRMFEGSDVTGDIREVLPPKLVFLAPTISKFLREKADALATQLIMSDRFTQLWTSANRSAHQRLVEVLRMPPARGEQARVLPYKINLSQAQQWLQSAAEKSDNAGLLNAATQVERVETFNASLRAGLNQMRAFVRASDALYALLPYVIMASFLSALALARKRYTALLGICGGVVAVNVLAIVGVNFMRPALLNMLENQNNRPIFNSLWSSLMPPFLDFARLAIIVSAIVMLIAFLWHKGLVARVVPRNIRKLHWFKSVQRFLESTHSFLIKNRAYIYGVVGIVAVFYLAFVPNQTPLKAVQVILASIGLAAFTSIITSPQRPTR